MAGHLWMALATPGSIMKLNYLVEPMLNNQDAVSEKPAWSVHVRLVSSLAEFIRPLASRVINRVLAGYVRADVFDEPVSG